MEGFGLVFLEAALFGKACIGGNSGGVREAIRHGRTGLVVDTSVGDRPLAEAMRLLLENPARALEFGLNGQADATTTGTWKHAAQEFCDLLDTASGDEAAPGMRTERAIP